MIRFEVFPRTVPPPDWVERLVSVFRRHEDEIGSGRAGDRLSSEAVLAMLSKDLEELGFRIERLRHGDRRAPGLAGAAARQGRAAENVHFDVYQPEWMCCLAIEDGHDWANIGATEDLVEPLLVSNVDTLCVAVPCTQEPGSGAARRASEFERTCDLAVAVYGHSRVQLPRRLLIIGY